MTLGIDAMGFLALRAAALPHTRTGNQALLHPKLSAEAVRSVATADARDVTQLPVPSWSARAPERRATPWLRIMVAALVAVAALRYELRTSALQSRLLSAWASRLSYTIEPGPSTRIVFPKGGPSDERLGFTRLPVFRERLEAAGYHVVEQASFSPDLRRLTALGIPPPFPEPMAAGLVARDSHDAVLYDARPLDRKFQRFDDIPPLLVRALLFIEDRELSEPVDPRSNPAVNWARLAKAGLMYAGHALGLPVRLEGGSTLATQIEKYRHSTNGITKNGLEKIKQMTSASLKAYRDGADTQAARRAIVLQFVNTMPLSAVRAYGEVLGLGDGLYQWFGLELSDVLDSLAESASPGVRARALKHVLALLCATRAPTHYLKNDRSSLEARVNAYTKLMESAGLIDEDLGLRTRRTPIMFASPPKETGASRAQPSKTVKALRVDLMQLLGEEGLYALDRLALDAMTTLDGDLEQKAALLFQNLRDRKFVHAHGLAGERLLSQGDPAGVVYSLILFEATPDANLLRVGTDTLEGPFSMNDGMKLELGSTAKLRTLAHYLEVLSILHEEFAGLDSANLLRQARAARDPITRWATEELARRPGMDLTRLLDLGLARKYSASPGESFFTGGGRHTFSNFDPDDNGQILTVREAAIRSTNLVFIRLMRDLVLFHEVRLPYDSRAVLAQPEHPERRRLLKRIAHQEGLRNLARSYRKYRGFSMEEIVPAVLGSRPASPRRLAILFFAWHPGSDSEELSRWLAERGQPMSAEEVGRLRRRYGKPEFTLLDHGFLLRRDPIDIWCAGKLALDPDMGWADMKARSGAARRVASSWLFRTRSRRAQDLRLRTWIEQDAFARMTPYWRRVGFPFERLVASYATAIGSSGDRPSALAELMGIVVNDGLRRTVLSFRQLRFGGDTPYHTVFEPQIAASERVMPAPVAKTLRQVLKGVVDRGTARRVKGVFVDAEGNPVTVGAKTGSGDNRFQTFRRAGGKLSSRPVSRTASLVFFIGNRYYGVITATVPGARAKDYRFTSALPLAVLKLLAPAISRRLGPEPIRTGTPPLLASARS